MADGAAAGRDGFDGQHRGDDANARLFRFELVVVPPIETCHIGAGAAHVKADRVFESGSSGHAGTSDDAAGRSGQDAVFSLKLRGDDQAAGRRHDSQIRRRRTVQLTFQAFQVVTQHRIQVGIHDGRVAARDKLDHGGDLAGEADLAKADFLRQTCHPTFVLGVQVGVQQPDRQGLDPAASQVLQARADDGLLWTPENSAVGRETFVDRQHRANSGAGFWT